MSDVLVIPEAAYQLDNMTVLGTSVDVKLQTLKVLCVGQVIVKLGGALINLLPRKLFVNDLKNVPRGCFEKRSIFCNIGVCSPQTTADNSPLGSLCRF